MIRLPWFLRRRPPKPDEFRAEVGIDTSGPEFDDATPSKDDLLDRLKKLPHFRPEAAEWIAATIADELRGAGGRDQAIKAVVRSGDLLSREAVKGLGISPSAKLGSRFVQSVAANRVKDAVAALTQIVHVASARAMHLHTLRRFEEAGIETVSLSSPRDERATETERRLDGVEMSIADARALVTSHEAEISRSAFCAVVTW